MHSEKTHNCGRRLTRVLLASAFGLLFICCVVFIVMHRIRVGEGFQEWKAVLSEKHDKLLWSDSSNEHYFAIFSDKKNRLAVYMRHCHVGTRDLSVEVVDNAGNSISDKSRTGNSFSDYSLLGYGTEGFFFPILVDFKGKVRVTIREKQVTREFKAVHVIELDELLPKLIEVTVDYQ